MDWTAQDASCTDRRTIGERRSQDASCDIEHGLTTLVRQLV